MSSRPLGLSQQQLDIVTNHARLLPVSWRSRFLESLADQLPLLDQVSDADVQHACARVVDRMGIAA